MRARRAARRSTRPARPRPTRPSRPGSPHVAVGRQPVQLLGVEVLEEEQRAQLVRASAAAGVRSSLLQVAVHERDGHRALADGRGDPLHRLGPDVAGDEHAGHAGLQEVRVAVQRPAGRRRPSSSRPGPVRTNPRSSRTTDAVEPVGARGAADEDEQVAGRVASSARRSARPAASAAPGGRCRAPRRPSCRCARDVGDRRRAARSGSATSTSSSDGPADQQVHRAGVPGEVHRRLSGRVRAADDVDVLVGALGRLGQRRAVVDAAAGQPVRAGDVEAAGRRPRWPGRRRARRSCCRRRSAAPAWTPCASSATSRGSRASRRRTSPPAGGPGRSAGRRRRRRGSRGSSRSGCSGPACPPVASRSTSTVRSPSEAP